MIGDARNDIVALFRGNELAAMLGVSFLAALFSLQSEQGHEAERLLGQRQPRGHSDDCQRHG